MKIRVIGFPSGMQWNLAFNDAVPDLSGDVGAKKTLTDDYGQTVAFTLSPDIAYLVQDADDLTKFQVAMMVRQEGAKAQAVAQLQSNPLNRLVHPGGAIM